MLRPAGTPGSGGRSSGSQQPGDVVADLGCGKGRVVCCATRFRIQKAIGVEVNPHHIQTAAENARRLRNRRAEIEIIPGLAQEADLSEATVYYLFNPFGAATLAQVAARIKAFTVMRRRPARIAYVLPKFGEVLDGSDWLERYDSWEPRPEIELSYPVAFWRSTGESLHTGVTG